MSYKLVSDAYSLDAETYRGEAYSFTVQFISPGRSTFDYIGALGQKVGFEMNDTPETILHRAVNYILDLKGCEPLRVIIWHDQEVGKSLKKYLGEYVGGITSEWFSILFDKYKITAYFYQRELKG